MDHWHAFRGRAASASRPSGVASLTLRAVEYDPNVPSVPSAPAPVALVLRAGGTADVVDMARMTLDPLDGRSPYPAQRDWMHERLAHLRRGLDPQLVTAHGT